MKNTAGSRAFLEFCDRFSVAVGLVTGRYVVTDAPADTSSGRQSDDPTGGQLAGEHSAGTTGRPAPVEPLGRVEVDGVTWLHLGQGEPLTARKCADADCSVCGFLPGPLGALWVALTGPLAGLADREAPEAPTGPERAVLRPLGPGFPGFAVQVDPAGGVRLGGRLVGLCDCPRCELGRARMSARPDTPGD